MTSKEALQRIGEYSEAAITIRGTYFPPGKEPKEGERKIYLAIESMYYYGTCQKYKSTKCPCTLRLFIICFGICLDCYKNVHIHEVDSDIIIEEQYLLSFYSKTLVT